MFPILFHACGLNLTHLVTILLRHQHRAYFTIFSAQCFLTLYCNKVLKIN